MSEFVSLMSGFKNFGKDGKTKGVIRVQSEELLFDGSDRRAAQAFADAMLETIKEHMLQGLAPDGQPLPPLTSSTLQRRAVEARQGQRGGEAHPRFTDPEFRAEVAKRYRRDYRLKGEEFLPVAEHPRGEVSGLLVESMVARGDKSGKGVTIYVAAKRSKPRPATTHRPQEKQSALESVLAGAPLVSPTLIEAPKIKKRMSEILKGMLGKPKDLKRAIKKLFGETAEELQGISEELD